MTQENNRKKILLVTRPIAPPWDEASKNFAFSLAKNTPGFEFYLLTHGIIQELPPNINQKSIYTSNKLTWLQRVRLLKLVRLRKDMDIIHFMLTPTKLNAFGFRAVVKSKNAKTIQTIATLREDLFSNADYKKILFADLIITYSDYAKNKLNSLGFNNVQRVYPGIDLNSYSPAPKDKEIQKLLGVTDEDFVIQYPGEFSRLGATDDLADLVVTYAEEFRKRKIKLCFPGRIKGKEDLNKKKEVEKNFQSKGVLDVVRFPDNLKTQGTSENGSMSRRYNTSDLVIFPVRDMKGKFDVPLAVIEAMACEKPVIISNLPILREFANENNSVTIQGGNVALLKDAIFELYHNKEKRRLIGKNARKFVEENFDIKKITGIYAEIYEKL